MQDIIGKIDSFFIFSSHFGSNESDESSKILFFYPNNFSTGAQKTQVGLSEAVIKFMTTFSIEPCEVLQTQTKRHIFYEPEKGYWMVMVIKRPYTTKPLSTCSDSKDTIEPSIIDDLLKCSYRMIRMFVGPFTNANFDDISVKCQEILPIYLSSKKLCFNICAIFQGIDYMSLDRKQFFKVVCFIDLIEVKFSDFKCVSFLCNDQLIWNGLDSADMLFLYQYLVYMLLPDQIQQETQNGFAETNDKNGRYIFPKGAINHDNYLHRFAKVYLTLEDSEETKIYYLVVYRSLNATISFVVDGTKNLELETLKSLDDFMKPQISSIASTLSDECVVDTLQYMNLVKTDSEKFVYFNKVNLAIRSSGTNKLSQTNPVNAEVLSIVADMHKSTKSLGSNAELTIKTPDEYWITGKCSNEREFYVIIQEKDANLKDISDKVKRVCDAQMKNEFFYPI